MPHVMTTTSAQAGVGHFSDFYLSPRPDHRSGDPTVSREYAGALSDPGSTALDRPAELVCQGWLDFLTGPRINGEKAHC